MTEGELDGSERDVGRSEEEGDESKQGESSTRVQGVIVMSEEGD
jgi:hypothetical protein